MDIAIETTIFFDYLNKKRIIFGINITSIIDDASQS
jgi:hypothetical protein